MIITRRNVLIFIWKAALCGENLGCGASFLEITVRLKVWFIYLLGTTGISSLLLYSGQFIVLTPTYKNYDSRS